MFYSGTAKLDSTERKYQLYHVVSFTYLEQIGDCSTCR
jgi:hypothetical protein